MTQRRSGMMTPAEYEKQLKNGTHKVIVTNVIRWVGEPGHSERLKFRPGDRITPTSQEMKDHPERFEKVKGN